MLDLIYVPAIRADQEAKGLGKFQASNIYEQRLEDFTNHWERVISTKQNPNYRDRILTNPPAAVIRKLNRALSLAALGNCHFRHGAVLMKGSRVLNLGINSYNEPIDSEGNIISTPASKDIIINTKLETQKTTILPQAKQVAKELIRTNLKPVTISTIHAEQAAFKGAKSHALIKDTTLYVARVGNSTLFNGVSTAQFSRPCNWCIKFLITKTNVAEVYYT